MQGQQIRAADPGLLGSFADRGNYGNGGTYVDRLVPFLGPPTRAVETRPSHAHSREAWTLPEAFKGCNEYIRDTLVEIISNDNNFMTSEILPWRHQENPNICWDEIRFDKTLVEEEPEQGVPRYVTVQSDSHSAYMTRRGLALIVNHGFANTEGGQNDFIYKVMTIAGAVQETCDQSGIVELLSKSGAYNRRQFARMREATNGMDLFQSELNRWGIIQHQDHGWVTLDAEAEGEMACENKTPDTWIVPARMKAYHCLGQQVETEAYRGGERHARDNLDKGPHHLTTFRGKTVYEVRPFQLDVDGRCVDLLHRERVIGDFFVVPCFGFTMQDGHALPQAYKGLTQVYCCETDKFETFTWRDVWNASGLGLDDGDDVQGLTSLFHHPERMADAGDPVPGAAAEDAAAEVLPGNAFRARANGALMGAVDIAIQNAYSGTDALIPSNGINTFAAAAHRAGYADQVSCDAHRQAIATEFGKVLQRSSDLTADDLRCLQYDENGAERPVGEVATDLHDAYLRGQDADGPYHTIARSATQHALKLAAEIKASGRPHEDGVFDHEAVAADNRHAHEAQLSAPQADLLCFRPFRRYRMGSGILCKRGSELGNTFRSNADFQLSDDIIAKTHIGHFTFMHASVVTNPKCMYLAENVICAGYLGGEGRTVLHCQHRAAFASQPMETMQQHKADIIVCPVPVGALTLYDHQLVLNNPISLTGVLPRSIGGMEPDTSMPVHIGDYDEKSSQTVVQLMADRAEWVRDLHNGNNNAKAQAVEPAGHSIGITGAELSARFSALWGFEGMNHDVDYDAEGSYDTSGAALNIMCFHTMQRFINLQSRKHEPANVNTGHFGPNGVYQGCRYIRNGGIAQIKDMGYEKLMSYG